MLRFYTVGSDGSTTLAFNATSIQNAVILGLFTLVLGALVLPLFGLSLGSLFGAESTGSGYGSQYGYSEPSYGSGQMTKNIYEDQNSTMGYFTDDTPFFYQVATHMQSLPEEMESSLYRLQ